MMRPVDISRKFGISTATIRKYELLGLTPPVSRSHAGYRVFSSEHVAYIACVREMLPAFSLIEITKIFEAVMSGEIDTALWIANKKQADLYREKLIAEKIAKSLLRRNGHQINVNRKELTINDISQETGVPATTIRHWDRVGLISVKRSPENNYRIFTTEHIKQILTIYALKLSLYSNHQKYSIEQIRESMYSFDYNDKKEILTMITAIEQHLSDMNRDQMKATSALFHLCVQVETNQFD
jgi:DNA-binding transcriptional MerR regulator